MRACKLDGRVELDADRRRQRTRLALRRLKLHQDRGESLREIVVDVTGKPVPLLEHRLVTLLQTAAFGDAMLMQRERRLAGDRLEDGDTPPLVRTRRRVGREREPS